jgi:hypothetical protein
LTNTIVAGILSNRWTPADPLSEYASVFQLVLEINERTDIVSNIDKDKITAEEV